MVKKVLFWVTTASVSIYIIFSTYGEFFEKLKSNNRSELEKGMNNQQETTDDIQETISERAEKKRTDDRQDKFLNSENERTKNPKLNKNFMSAQSHKKIVSDVEIKHFLNRHGDTLSRSIPKNFGLRLRNSQRVSHLGPYLNSIAKGLFKGVIVFKGQESLSRILVFDMQLEADRYNRIRRGRYLVELYFKNGHDRLAMNESSNFRGQQGFLRTPHNRLIVSLAEVHHLHFIGVEEGKVFGHYFKSALPLNRQKWRNRKVIHKGYFLIKTSMVK
jgi:hypothetical protein